MKNHLNDYFFTIFTALLLALIPIMGMSQQVRAQETVHFVTLGGGGGCTGWADACDLQTALASASSGDEIWAAAGVYKPTNTADRAATFQLKDGVAVYGGFAGTESSRDARDPVANLTILSGDLSGDDGVDFANNSENSYHVVTGANYAILDGVTITAGNANGPTDTINSSGGGMYNENSSPTLSSVTFSGNSANFGGGMYNVLSSSPTLSSVTFSGNRATWNGGGMYNHNSSPTLSSVTFSGNTAELNGGGIYNNSSSPTLTNATFSGNKALRYHGGGIDNISSSPTLNSVVFSGNTANSRGGGMHNSGSSPTLTDVTFSGNRASRGGGMFNSGSHPSLSNVAFSGNSATYYGGGMFNSSSSNPILSSVTFSGNSAGENGGGMYNQYNSSPVIRNTILWGDTGGELVNDSTSSATITSSVVQGGCPAGAACTDLISADPRLGALGSYGGDTQTIPLLPGSSAIDAGDGSLCPATDQRGVPRPQGAGCDTGAFESQGFVLAKTTGDNQAAVFNSAFTDPLALTVTANAPGEPVDGGQVTFTPPGSGASAAIGGSPAAITGGQASVTATANNTTGSYNVAASAAGATSVNFALTNLCAEAIIVQNANDSGAGSLREAIANICPNGAITFAGDTTIYLNSTLTIQHNLTIDGSGRSVTISGDGIANVRLFFVDTGAAAVMEHLSLTNGGCTTGACDGGAIYNTGILTLNDSILSGNRGRQGAAIFNGGAMTVTSTTFSDNVAQDGAQTIGFGGAVLNGGAMTVTGSTFSGNKAYGYEGKGGAIFNTTNQLTVTNTTFSSNWAQVGGGAIYAWYGSTEISSSTFTGNSAGTGGGIYVFNGAKLTVANSTFSNNSATGSGGGLFNRGVTTVTNSTFERTKLYNYSVSNPAILTVYNSIVAGPNEWISPRCGEGPITGSNNLADDDSCGPAFTISPTILLGELGSYGGDTQTIPLLPGSSAIDTGDGTVCPATDQRGVPRPQGVGCDIGAYEKRQITVTADAITRYSGQPDPALTYQITSGQLADGDVFSGALSRAAGEAPGTYPILQGSLTLSDNYLLSYTSADFTILPAADLSVTNTDSKDPIKPGASLVYTLVVSNNGPDASQSVSVVDNLDRDTIYVSTSAPKGWACIFAAGKVTCTNSSLAAGSTATIKITVTVAKTAKIGKELVNIAEVSSITHDLVPANNSSLQKTLVIK